MLWAEEIGADETAQSIPGLTLNSNILQYSTDKLGHWVLINLQNKQASLISPDKEIRAKWNANCNLTTFTHNKNQTDDDVFTDKELNDLLLTNQPGIIYSWSPSMNYSVTGIEEIRMLCDLLGLTCTILLDPNSDQQLAHKIYQDDNIYRKAASIELLFRGMFIHAPSILFYKQGKIMGPVIPGYRTIDQHLETISSRLGIKPNN